MSIFPSESQVVIVGAGPTGLGAANLLASYGVPVLVLERNPAPLDLPRAIVLDEESARILQVFGADKTYIRPQMAGEGATCYDDIGHAFAHIPPTPPLYGFAERYHISQPALESALIDHAANNPAIDLRFDCEVLGLTPTAQGVTLEVIHGQGRPHRIETAFVLACDGGRSQIREALGIRMSGSTYGQDWLVIDTEDDPDDAPIQRYYCNSTRPHVSLPTPGGGRRYEFMLHPGESREMALETAFIAKLLAPHRAISDAQITRREIYLFHARTAQTFRAGRVLLLGDAAHLAPPFAGQGMNAGLRDAQNLAWKIAMVLKGGAKAEILDSYEVERRGRASGTIRRSVAMGDVVMPKDAARLTFRNRLSELLAPYPEVRDHLLEMRFKAEPRYTKGLFLGLGDASTGFGEARPSLVGAMIPQPMVDLAGKETLLDHVLGPGFALIAQDSRGAAALAAYAPRWIFGLPLSKLRLCWEETPNQPRTLPCCQLDPKGVGRGFRAHRGQIILIRPDRFCAAAFSPSELKAGLQRIGTIFGAYSISTKS